MGRVRRPRAELVGIRYDRLEEQGIQWPCPDLDHPGSRFLHAPRPGATGRQGQVLPGRVPAADRAARLRVPVRPLDRPDALPLQLGDDDHARGRASPTSRRSRSSRSRAEDASQLGLADGDSRGSSRAAARSRRARVIGDRVYPGLVWMALHFAQAKVNWLTHDVGDSLIGTPEYKVSAVARRASPQLIGEPFIRRRRSRVRVDAAPPARAPTRPRARSRSPTTRRRDAGGSAARGRRRQARRSSARSLLRPPPERRAAGARRSSARSPPRTPSRRDRALRPDQVAERRHAQPAQGGGRARRAPRRLVMLGIGINVNQTREQLAARRTPAGRIAAHGHRTRARPRATLLATLLARLERHYDVLARGRPRRALPGHRARATSCAAAASRWTGSAGIAVGIDRIGPARAGRGRRAAARRERRSRLLRLGLLLRPVPGAGRLVRDRRRGRDVSRVGA